MPGVPRRIDIDAEAARLAEERKRVTEAQSPKARKVTYAGELDYGDAEYDPATKTVTIKRGIRPERQMERDLASLLDASGLHDVAAQVRVHGAPAFRTLPPDRPPVSRTARAGSLVTISFGPGANGEAWEDVRRQAAEAAGKASSFMPGTDLEAWGLPVTSFEHSFLLTPADLES